MSLGGNSKLLFITCRPEEFVVCELPPPDLNGNRTAKEERGYGCLKVNSILIYASGLCVLV